MTQTLVAGSLPSKLSSRDQILAKLALAFVGSWLMALLAQAKLVLPFTPVPVTGQTLAMLLIGASLGARTGMASVGLYLAQGMLGLPFFAGGAFGIAPLLGTSAGFLLGMIPGAYLCGKLSEKGLDRSYSTSWLPFVTGLIPVFVLGTIVLSTFFGWENAFKMGVLPFLPGELVKIIIASAAFPTLWKTRQKLLG